MKEKRPEEINNWLLKAALDCVKDETSLDIDLSACAPIPSAPNDNTLSDVWNTNQEGLEKEPALQIPEGQELIGLAQDDDSNACSLMAGVVKARPVAEVTCQETSSPRRIPKLEAVSHTQGSPGSMTAIRDASSSYTLPHTMIKAEPGAGLPCQGPVSLATTCSKETFKCKNCEEEFDSKESLKAHGKVHRNSKRNEVYTCPVCDKQLKVSSMWLHRKIHNESERFSCDICGQKFVQKINLIHHTKAHLGEKPFECSQCQMSFPERSHLIKHQRYHTSTRQYKCEKCGKMYKTERCLKVHNLVHLEKRPFVCSECNKSFISSSKLKQHSNIHTGERPYKCKYCARDFTNFPNWLKHTRRRHKVDHKTGELLQNVPSYVSKKSNKKEKKLKVNETTEAVELPAKTKTESTFTDIYAMSLNSAEELIMEQALEMEESGYLMSPPSDATLGSPPLLSQFEYMSPAPQESTPELPLSSLTSNCQYYLPSLSPLHTNISTISSPDDAGQQNYTRTLPSVETLFASSFQKASLPHH
ncbi:unnamed protein product [Hermetia illucens]|uniref:C2H2-type domain-containing protein n=1 Tax=Hermetia illucens TaxID=343691 RepID=A0A7R8UQ60_HERIL|nr:serendipity locus protein H-1-like [Hermetia illucens]CAD7084038.1 unnamed protein product [Hermetia illucens]